MRNLIIKFFDYFIWALLALGIVVSLITGLGTMFSPFGGFLRGLIILLGGVCGSVVSAGAAFLIVGIYENTKAMAERR